MPMRAICSKTGAVFQGAAVDVPMIVNDYKHGGYNFKIAEEAMFGSCMHQLCYPCGMAVDSEDGIRTKPWKTSWRRWHQQVH